VERYEKLKYAERGTESFGEHIKLSSRSVGDRVERRGGTGGSDHVGTTYCVLGTGPTHAGAARRVGKPHLRFGASLAALE